MNVDADWVGALSSLIAALIAWGAWRVARQTFYRDHRPIVRVVAIKDDHEPDGIALDAVLLKNIGRGPALTVIAYDPDHKGLIGDVDAVEPLGPGDTEAERLGRTRMALPRGITMDRTYELYYQDTAGQWHLTRCRPIPGRIECSFPGAMKRAPGAVTVIATVAKP